MKPFWTTFYSYKGGVGRTLALTNLAALLVKAGRRVVLIDFDLEAPGLDSFTELASATGKYGVVEYVAHFQERKTAAPIQDYLHPCTLPGSLRGHLWLMPAGTKDPHYNFLLNRIQWAQLYKDGVGTAFFENWKAAINRYCQPDYVFIDSRTGLTEIGGVCTTQLPDLVIMLFGLNNQNIKGTSTVSCSIKQAVLEKTPLIHYVATPVPNLPIDKRSELQIRLDAASRQLSTIDSTIRYFASAALSEKIFTLSDTRPTPQIVTDYQELFKKLVSYNQAGLDYIETQLDDALKKADTTKLDRITAILEREYNTRSDGLFMLSRIAGSRAQIQKALSLSEQACRIDPAFAAPFEFLTDYYERAKEFEKIIDLSKELLKSSHLSKQWQRHLYNILGRFLMAVSDVENAEQAFAKVYSLAGELKEPAFVLTVTRFNALEAHRRNQKVTKLKDWMPLLADLRAFAYQPGQTPAMQANRLQALHVALAVLGNIDQAKATLLQAKKAALAAGELEDIFSLKHYRKISVSEFLDTNEEMINSLQSGCLWDGFKLGGPESKSHNGYTPLL